MEITTKITLDMLTEDSVSVLKQQFIDNDGQDMQAGENIRTAYMNTSQSREILQDTLPSEYYNAVISVWGDIPNIICPIEEGE